VTLPLLTKHDVAVHVLDLLSGFTSSIQLTTKPTFVRLYHPDFAEVSF
jgi:hypothetical protein